MAVQSWTNSNSASWRVFEQQVAKYRKPTAWVGADLHLHEPGTTFDDFKQLIANARARGHQTQGSISPDGQYIPTTWRATSWLVLTETLAK
jgi:hypothetical protein